MEAATDSPAPRCSSGRGADRVFPRMQSRLHSQKVASHSGQVPSHSQKVGSHSQNVA
jgi:hypothetical protein